MWCWRRVVRERAHYRYDNVFLLTAIPNSREGPFSQFLTGVQMRAQRQGFWSGHGETHLLNWIWKNQEIEKILAPPSIMGRRLGYEPASDGTKRLGSCSLSRVRRVYPFESDEKASVAGWQVKGHGWMFYNASFSQQTEAISFVRLCENDNTTFVSSLKEDIVFRLKGLMSAMQETIFF